VWNLLSNAIKFTPPGGSVELEASQLPGVVEVQVRDTGQGIRPDFLPQVFGRFRQQDSSSTRKQGGLGLGLAIVRNLVESHGGRIEARSPGEGKGATFTFQLPVRTSRIELPAAAPRKAGHSPAFPADGEPSGRLEGRRILIVDDEEDALEIVQRIFTERGAEVRVARTVTEAFELHASFHPEVLVTDIGMPLHDGYELIGGIRERESGSGSTPVLAIALTAFAGNESRRRAKHAGFDLHVPKPVEPTVLLAAVGRLVAARANGNGRGRRVRRDRLPIPAQPAGVTPEAMGTPSPGGNASTRRVRT